MPRKSTASSTAGMPPPMDANADVSILSTVTTEVEPSSQPQAHRPEGKNARQSTGADGGSSGGGGTSGANSKGKADTGDLTIDDLLLPRTLISRLSRGSLPANTQIQRDALLALTKSATVFISYLAHHANNVTSRKTIQAQDVLDALKETELDGVMGDKLRKEIEFFEEGVKGKRKGYRERVRARGSKVGVDENGDRDSERGHESKRVRIAEGERDMEENRDEAASRQLNAEIGDAVSSQHDNSPQTHSNNTHASQLLRTQDETETDPEIVDEDDSDEDENLDEQDDEIEGEDDVDGDDDGDEDEEDGEEDDEANTTDDEDRLEIEIDRDHGEDGLRRGDKARTLLAPNGRVEVGESDDESD